MVPSFIHILWILQHNRVVSNFSHVYAYLRLFFSTKLSSGQQKKEQMLKGTEWSAVSTLVFKYQVYNTAFEILVHPLRLEYLIQIMLEYKLDPSDRSLLEYARRQKLALD
jgi:hypothetical protein